MATAVGVNVLPRIVKPLASGIRKRWKKGNFEPLNIIICENLIDANRYLEGLLKRELAESGEQELFDKKIGLVEASIGRMVPVMSEEMKKENILRVCVEEYCELPVDKDAFKGSIPDIVNMIPFSPFEFFIQRKLFIHNMGHAVAAYLGYLKGYTYIWEAVGDEKIRHIVKKAMTESANALTLEHGVPLDQVLAHADDLIKRFGNRKLQDTIARVGKDPKRKLSFEDRLIGAARLCVKNGIFPEHICIGIAAALHFNHESDPYALEIQDSIKKNGIGQTLKDICRLGEESSLYQTILDYYEKLALG